MLIKLRLLTERAHFSSLPTKTISMTLHSTQRNTNALRMVSCAFKVITTLHALAPLSYYSKSVNSPQAVHSFANRTQKSRGGCNENLSWSHTTNADSVLKPLISQRLCRSRALNGFLSTVKFERKLFSRHLWCNYSCKIVSGNGLIGLKKTLMSLKYMRQRNGRMSLTIMCMSR